MEIRLPQLGEGAESGAVANIFVKEGDTIQKDQPMIELESEKAVAAIPSPAAGKVTKIHVKQGDTVKVGQAILTVAEVGTVAAVADRGPAEPQAPPRPVSTATTPRQIPGIPIAAAPTVRKLAAELGIDLTRVAGSEPGGRITMADLRGYIQQLQQTATAAPVGARHAVPLQAPEDFAKWGAVSRQPLSRLRQVIARRMHESWTAIPHVTQFDEADITALNDLRKKHAEAYEKRGVRLTLTPLVLRALAGVLKKHPSLNASLDEAAQEIVLKEYIHVGIAVDTEHGLIVPVIRDVDKKDLLTLSKELEDLAEKARQRKFSGDDLKGHSFTISNQGGIGGGHFTPIINKPDVAILGLGRGALKPVVRGKTIEPRLLLPLALSYDHRVLDGANAARFIVDLVKAIEEFPEDQVKL